MEQRRPPPSGRFWRRRREPVPATTGSTFDLPMWFDDDGGDDDDWGSAGVREPRRPLPLGPMAGAGEAVPSDPPLAAQLPDPRYQ